MSLKVGNSSLSHLLPGGTIGFFILAPTGALVAAPWRLFHIREALKKYIFLSFIENSEPPLSLPNPNLEAPDLSAKGILESPPPLKIKKKVRGKTLRDCVEDDLRVL